MPKILIIEDDETLGKMYQRKLIHEHFEVAIAYSGEEGIIAAQKIKPDLILLDITMPGIDGFEVIKRIKKLPFVQNIPIIILTNLGTSEIFIDEAKILGVNNYLIKYKTSSNTVVEKIKEELEIKTGGES